MLSSEGNQNGEKTTIGLISKKATLHVQHTFFVHFFAVVLQDYNVKIPETSWLHLLWRKCHVCSCSLLFFTAAYFHLPGRQLFSFSHRRFKIFMFFFQRNWSPSLFISLSLALSLLLNVEIKILWKERLGFVVV